MRFTYFVITSLHVLRRLLLLRTAGSAGKRVTLRVADSEAARGPPDHPTPIMATQSNVVLMLWSLCALSGWGVSSAISRSITQLPPWPHIFRMLLHQLEFCLNSVAGCLLSVDAYVDGRSRIDNGDFARCWMVT
jgi:hypothetical protein